MKPLLFRACVCACALVACEASARTLVEVTENRTLTAEEEIAADTVFDVKEGVTLDMASRALTIAGVTGKGAVANAALTLTLAEGPYRFDGTMAGTLTFSKTDDVPLDAFHLVLGNGDAMTSVVYTSPNVAATPIWFVPGIWQYSFAQIKPSASERFTTEDTNGDPVSVCVTKIAEGFNSSWRVIGSGDFYIGNRFGGGGINYLAFSEFTGRFRVGGSQETVFNQASLNGLSELEISGGFPYKLTDTTVPWPIYFTKKSATLAVAGNLTSEIVLPSSRIRSLADSWTLNYSGKLRLKDGCFYQDTDGRSIAATGAAELIFDNASPGANKWPMSNRYDSAAGHTKICCVTLTNGAWYGINSSLPTNFVITTGSHYYASSESSTAATEANPGIYFVDDANFDYINIYYSAINVMSAKYELHVGPKGARLHGFKRCSAAGGLDGRVYGLVRTAAGYAKDGGVTTSGSGSWQFFKPLAITGPFTLRNGAVAIPSGYTGTAESQTFGAGDFVFGSGTLSDGSSLTTIPLANAAGAKVKIDGVADLIVASGDTWTFGPSGATASSLARTPGLGGVLDIVAAGSDSATVPVIVRGGVETAATGLPKVPVVLRTSKTEKPWFAEYVADAGFRRYSGAYAESVAACTASSIFRPTASATLADDLAVAAIDMNGATITIGEGKTLTVGDGTNPAVVLLNNGSTVSATFGGAGTLDFGTSEGVFVAPKSRGRTDHENIGATIAGSAGVSYHGVWAGGGNGDWNAVNVTATNTYAGGTRLCGIAVYAKSTKAFSDGTVTVDGGSAHGSRIVFAQEGLVLSNDVVASGHGGPHCNSASDVQMGAINFAYNAELAGNLTCADRVFIGTFETSRESYREGILSGVVSGEDAVILPGPGAVVMTNTNTVRHTEIFGKLILRGNNVRPCTGDLIFGGTDSSEYPGVLRIENTEPVTISTRIVGKGTIELAGTAPVTFADAHQFQGTVDLCGGDRTVYGLGEFVDLVTNTVAETTATLTLGDARLGNTVVRTGLAAASGAVVNLQTQAQTLSTLGGAGRVLGGPVTVTGEIHPGGEGAVGTLSLGRGVTLGADAKLVTEVDAGGIDKLSVDGDFSLDGLPLEVRRLTRSPERTGTIFETSETLSGAWESVTLPARGKYELSEILDASRVDLTVVKPGVAIFFN